MIGWGLLLALEIILLGYTQRRVVTPWDVRLPRFLSTFLMLPGTALHELAHALMCILCGVKLGKVALFSPKQLPNGNMQYGYISHGPAGVLRSALISIAPVLFVPLFLLALTYALLGTLDPSHIFEAPWPRILLWFVLLILGSRAAFPSIGDHIGFFGGIALGGLLFIIIYALMQSGHLEEALHYTALGLAPAAGGSALLVATSSRTHTRNG